MAHHDFAQAERNPADYTGADAQYFETPAGAGYEHTDADVWTIVRFGLWLAVSAVIIHVGLGFTYAALIERATVVAEPRYPLASSREQTLPAEPRLQQDPRADMYRFRLQEDSRLHEYGWVNREAGVVHLPIDEAMRRLVESGSLPSRPVDASQAVPGLLASDPSSGRLMERRRQ